MGKRRGERSNPRGEQCWKPLDSWGRSGKSVGFSIEFSFRSFQEGEFWREGPTRPFWNGTLVTVQSGRAGRSVPGLCGKITEALCHAEERRAETLVGRVVSFCCKQG